MTADGSDRSFGAPRFDVVLRGYDRRQVDEHLSRLWAEADAGRVLLAGGAGDPVSEGIIVWDVDDPAEIHAYAQSDSYMKAGLITSYDVVPWRTVVGQQAQAPLRP